MISRDQTCLVCKKNCFRFVGFLLTLTFCWYFWLWIVPPQPRAFIVPFSESDFVSFSSDSRMLITREPQWNFRPGSTLWDVMSHPSRIQLWDAQNGTLLRTYSAEWADMDRVIPSRD